MAKRCKCPRSIGAFGEPAHTSRLFIGQKTADGQGAVPAAAMEKVIRSVTSASGGRWGAATAYPARGQWVGVDGKVVTEDTQVVEVVSAAAGATCPRLHERMKRLAAQAALTADQQAVLAVTTCANGHVEADLVDREGKAPFPILRLPGVERAEARRPLRRVAGALGYPTTRRRKRPKR